MFSMTQCGLVNVCQYYVLKGIKYFNSNATCTLKALLVIPM